MGNNLAGKTALITGSGRGIGRGIAIALAAQGCNIIVNYFRRREDAEQTAAEVEQLGVRAIIVKAHVGEEEQMKRLVDEATRQLGGVDIFVANAASGVLRPLLEIDSKAWDWTLNINARSILVGAQAVTPHMQNAGWGRIITISSLGSRRVFPEYSAVGVSKAAIETLTRYLAVELAPKGIICNCVSPGLVLTGALEHFPSQEKMIEYAQQNTPVGRLATPADVAALVVWLCSNAASMVVGQTIEVDGGYSLVAFG